MSTKFEMPKNFTNTSEVVMVRAPFSSNPSDNAVQGKITGGALNKLFDAPVKKPDSFDQTRAIYESRLIQTADDVAVKKPVEAFRPMPGLKDSDLITAEAFTQEDYTAIICLLVGVITLIIAGACFGFWGIHIKKLCKKGEENLVEAY